MVSMGILDKQMWQKGEIADDSISFATWQLMKRVMEI